MLDSDGDEVEKPPGYYTWSKEKQAQWRCLTRRRHDHTVAGEAKKVKITADNRQRKETERLLIKLRAAVKRNTAHGASLGPTLQTSRGPSRVETAYEDTETDDVDDDDDVPVVNDTYQSKEERSLRAYGRTLVEGKTLKDMMILEQMIRNIAENELKDLRDIYPPEDEKEPFIHPLQCSLANYAKLLQQTVPMIQEYQVFLARILKDRREMREVLAGCFDNMDKLALDFEVNDQCYYSNFKFVLQTFNAVTLYKLYLLSNVHIIRFSGYV